MESNKLVNVTPTTTVSINEKKVVCRNIKKILSEEEFSEKLEKIITRDFFPDLPKLKAQNEYLDAVEKGDITKIQEIQLAYRPGQSSQRRSDYVSSFDTPDIRQGRNGGNGIEDDLESQNNDADQVSLDKFLNKNTSEDNASFQVIMVKADTVHQQKYPWLYKNEEAEQKKIDEMLALPPVEKKESPELVTWAYKNKNALMYVPDGVKFTAEEALANENRKEITHKNTRFESPPFDEEANKEAIAEAASVQAKMKEGRVGIDGKEIIPPDSPQVNGYGFVSTPAPEPGEGATPIMTWGEIEGTPFRLDGGDTPLRQNPSGQQFKIPNLSARERIALSLANKVSKKNSKSSSQKNLSNLSPRLSGSMTPLEKLQNMSPAARKLACQKLGVTRHTDKALRASYSPSPLLQSNSYRTPSIISSPTSPILATPKIITPDCTEILPSGPKRHKASDFF